MLSLFVQEDSMGRPKKETTEKGKIDLDFGTPNPKQIKFLTSRNRYIGYGGARGGGKTWVLRVKAIGGAMQYAGIKILIVRLTYRDLQNSLIEPLCQMLPQGYARYNSTLQTIYFKNGSYIKFGHYDTADAALEYQGSEYDWIFIDEATQLTEEKFRTLGACLRGTSKIPRRMYLTCNPGGVGHMWVKRLFIDRQYKEGERAQDYRFIAATVDDNEALKKGSPDYVQMLDLLPEDIRRAHRYGDWDALAGTYFSEFQKGFHTFKPFLIPQEWAKYRVFDYGLDMFACLWVAVDFGGRCWVYREVQQDNLVVSDAAELMRSLTPPNEVIQYTIAPPDMWSRTKDTGKSLADLWMENGVGIVKASNNRVQGWLALKELLKPDGKENKPMLMVSEECAGLITNLPMLQHDDKNPSDCSTEPHSITHICDAARYFAVTRTLQPEIVKPVVVDDDFEEAEDYDEFMTGGEMDSSYLYYGGA